MDDPLSISIFLKDFLSISIFSELPYRYRFRYRYFPELPYRYQYRYRYFQNDPIDIFQKYRYIDNRYSISIYRTGLNVHQRSPNQTLMKHTKVHQTKPNQIKAQQRVFYTWNSRETVLGLEQVGVAQTGGNGQSDQALLGWTPHGFPNTFLHKSKFSSRKSNS